MLGQSMGAYVSIVLGYTRPRTVVLSFAPQTYDTRKQRVSHHPAITASQTPSRFQDLRDVILRSERKAPSVTYVIVSMEETKNIYESTPRFFWGDMLHAGYLLGLEGIQIVVLPSRAHAAFGK
eukprot:45658-Eustigmatos_ZCMA.PRE.1